MPAELMELEVSELIGAERGERRPQDRATHRNGYRPRRWHTRAGEIELRSPRSDSRLSPPRVAAITSTIMRKETQRTRSP
jgi:transposase-like protein